MATLVEVYVDPDATGAANGTSFTDAYTSLNAAFTAEAKDLVAADEVMRFNCRNSAGSDDTAAASTTGFTKDATRYVIITVAAGYRHNGTFGSGYQMKGATDFGGRLTLGEHDVAEYVAVWNTGTSSARGVFFRQNSVLFGCLATSGASTGEGFRYNPSTTGVTAAIINCIARDSAGRGFFVINFGVGDFYNCTAIDCTGVGFERDGASGGGPLVRNCVSFGNGTSYATGGSAWNAASSHNASDDVADTAHPGAGSGNQVVGLTSADFEADLITPTSAGDLAGAGVDLTTGYNGFDRTDYDVVITDAFGTARSTWDIGAVVATAAAGGVSVAAMARGSNVLLGAGAVH